MYNTVKKAVLFLVTFLVIGMIGTFIIVNSNNDIIAQTVIITVPSEDYKSYLSQSVIPDFNNEFPDINIKIKVMSKILNYDYEKNINHIINILPQTDILIGISYSQYNEIVKAQELYELDSLFSKTSLRKENFCVPIIPAITKDGHIYAIPVGFFNYALAFNKSIFDKHGIGYPKDGMTWDQVMELSEQIHKKSKELYGIALNFEEFDSLATPLQKLTFPLEGNFYILSNNKVTLNQGKIEPFLAYYKKGIQEGYIAPSILDFFRGNTAMGFVGLYDFDVYNNANDPTFKRINYSLVAAPKFTGVSNSYILPGDMIGISKYSNNVDSSWVFLDFFVKNFYKYHDSGTFGWFPAYRDGHKSISSNHYSFNFDSFYFGDKIVNQETPIYNGLQYNDFNRLVSPYINDYIHNKIDISKLWQETSKKLTDRFYSHN